MQEPISTLQKNPTPHGIGMGISAFYLPLFSMTFAISSLGSTSKRAGAIEYSARLRDSDRMVFA